MANNTITKTEYRILKNEVEELREKMNKIEEIIKMAQRKKKEEEILAIAKEAEELAKKGRLSVLRSLRDLR